MVALLFTSCLIGDSRSITRVAQRMYILLVYEVDISRAARVHQFLQRHLTWVRNCVFEGGLSQAQAHAVKAGLRDLVKPETDSVLIYTAHDQRRLATEVIGRAM